MTMMSPMSAEHGGSCLPGFTSHEATLTTRSRWHSMLKHMLCALICQPWCSPSRLWRTKGVGDEEEDRVVHGLGQAGKGGEARFFPSDHLECIEHE